MDYDKAKDEWQYNNGLVAGARVLLELPLDYKKCSSGMYNWYWSTVEKLDSFDGINAGKLACMMLKNKLNYLRNL